MPTALPRPWPSGPVVVSTPGVSPCSGCPGVMLPQVRRAFRSSRVSPYPDRYSWMYRVRLECPQDSTKRSRPAQCGSAGSCLSNRWKSK